MKEITKRFQWNEDTYLPMKRMSQGEHKQWTCWQGAPSLFFYTSEMSKSWIRDSRLDYLFVWMTMHCNVIRLTYDVRGACVWLIVTWRTSLVKRKQSLKWILIQYFLHFIQNWCPYLRSMENPHLEMTDEESQRANSLTRWLMGGLQSQCHFPVNNSSKFEEMQEEFSRS